jgi:hypothetical protein
VDSLEKTGHLMDELQQSTISKTTGEIYVMTETCPVRAIHLKDSGIHNITTQERFED